MGANFIRLTKVQLEQKIQLLEQELIFHKTALEKGDHFDWEKCNICGGQGWHFIGQGIENRPCSKCKRTS